jgi:hypothetical protein
MKVDFHKAFNSVVQGYLEKVMSYMGFWRRWTSLIRQCIARSKLAIFITVKKLINTNENIDRNIPVINCSKFYLQKYFIDIY